MHDLQMIKKLNDEAARKVQGQVTASNFSERNRAVRAAKVEKTERASGRRK